jgi:hypothetical protein
MTKLIEFSLSFFSYGKRMGSENFKIGETFGDVLFWREILFVFRGRGHGGQKCDVKNGFWGFWGSEPPGNKT